MLNSRRITDIREMGDDFKKAVYAIDVRRYDLAIEILHRVLSSQPENSMAFYTLARAYSMQKQHGKALEALRETLRLDANNSYAHALYGALLSETGKEQYYNAEEEMLIALRQDPSNGYAHYVYANFLLDRKKDFAAAQVHCSKALEFDPADIKLHWLQGRIYLVLGDIERAEAAFRYGLSLDPEDARLHNSYGALLFNQKHLPEAAFEHFRTAIQLRPDDPDYRKNFLLMLKAKHKFYWLFWNYGLMRRKLGRMYLLVIVAVVILIRLPIEVANQIPAAVPIATILVCALILFYVYMFSINPLFNFLIKRGWLK